MTITTCSFKWGNWFSGIKVRHITLITIINKIESQTLYVMDNFLI